MIFPTVLSKWWSTFSSEKGDFLTFMSGFFGITLGLFFRLDLLFPGISFNGNGPLYIGLFILAAPLLVYFGVTSLAFLLQWAPAPQRGSLAGGKPIGWINFIIALNRRIRVLASSPCFLLILSLFLVGCLVYASLPIKFLLGPIWSALEIRLSAENPQVFWGTYGSPNGFAIARVLHIVHPLGVLFSSLLGWCSFTAPAPELHLLVKTMEDLREAANLLCHCDLRGLIVNITVQGSNFAATVQLLQALQHIVSARQGYDVWPFNPWGMLVLALLIWLGVLLFSLGGAILRGYGPAIRLLAAVDKAANIKVGVATVAFLVAISLFYGFFGIVAWGGLVRVFSAALRASLAAPVVRQLHAPFDAAHLDSLIRQYPSLLSELPGCSSQYLATADFGGGLIASLASAGMAQSCLESAVAALGANRLVDIRLADPTLLGQFLHSYFSLMGMLGWMAFLWLIDRNGGEG